MAKNSVKKKTLEMLGKAAGIHAGIFDHDWPPCVGIIYQPKRPKRK